MSIDCSVEIEQGNGVTIEFTAENAGSEPVELTFSDGQTVEAVVGEADDPIWRYGSGKMFTQAIRTERLAPDEQLVERVEWPDPAPGEYEVRAWLCADNVDCEATANVSVRA
ncbi:MAG: BsuPI-related putative proteinase inhibitor [Halapricum sp.]